MLFYLPFCLSAFRPPSLPLQDEDGSSLLISHNATAAVNADAAGAELPTSISVPLAAVELEKGSGIATALGADAELASPVGIVLTEKVGVTEAAVPEPVELES